MRLVFAGTPEFAVPALDALQRAGHQIPAVYTQPDRPAGRGQKLQPSAVGRRAAELGIPVFKPERLADAAVEALRQLQPEVMVVVAYGLILPPPVLAIPQYGCLNIHASLLPRWRGAAPLQRAILAGDTQTGVTIMRMEAGLDTGPMLLQEAVALDETTTTAQLHDQLAALGARLIVDALDGLGRGTLVPRPQPEAGVTYAHKISKDEARLDWSQPAIELDRRVRAYNPVPIAWTELEGERVRIHAARPLAEAAAAAPGTIVAVGDRIHVATGAGQLAIEVLQWPGGRVLAAAQASLGRQLEGRRFR